LTGGTKVTGSREMGVRGRCWKTGGVVGRGRTKGFATIGWLKKKGSSFRGDRILGQRERREEGEEGVLDASEDCSDPQASRVDFCVVKEKKRRIRGGKRREAARQLGAENRVTNLAKKKKQKKNTRY